MTVAGRRKTSEWCIPCLISGSWPKTKLERASLVKVKLQWIQSACMSLNSLIGGLQSCYPSPMSQCTTLSAGDTSCTGGRRGGFYGVPTRCNTFGEAAQPALLSSLSTSFDVLDSWRAPRLLFTRLFWHILRLEMRNVDRH